MCWYLKEDTQSLNYKDQADKVVREIAAVACKNDKQHMIAVCEENAEDSHVKARYIDICSVYHSALNA